MKVSPGEVFLLHDKGEPLERRERLERIVREIIPVPVLGIEPPGIEAVDLERAANWIHFLSSLYTSPLVVGIGYGGAIAATLQDEVDTEFSTVVINSPTKWDGGLVRKKGERRVAVYSSQYEPIQGVCNWSGYAEASYDNPLFRWGVYQQPHLIGNLIRAHLHRPEDGIGIWLHLALRGETPD